MINRKAELKVFRGSVIFLVVYTLFLFLFRLMLLNAEKGVGTILKPEPFHIGIIALIVIIYYFTLMGIQQFAALGGVYKYIGIVFSILLIGIILYGFRQWYAAIIDNPFVLAEHPEKLPWYAKDTPKFLLANAPLILYFLAMPLARWNIRNVKNY